MFNEILTGKSTLERAPAQASPYREESVPQITLVCSDCQARYQAPVGTPPGRCGACHVALVSRNQAASTAALHESLAAIDERRRHYRWFRRAMILAVACVLAFIKFEMRKDLAASQPREQPVYISDPYIDQIRSYAIEMCACPDAACTTTVRAKWMNWQRYAIQPTDSGVLDGAADATNELMACFNKPR